MVCQGPVTLENWVIWDNLTETFYKDVDRIQVKQQEMIKDRG
jgi:hypothetical protein